MSQPLAGYQHLSSDLESAVILVYLTTLIGLRAASVLLAAVLQRLPLRLRLQLQSSRLYLWLKANLLYAPLLEDRKSQEIILADGKLRLGSPPSRAHTLTILLFLSTNTFVVCYDQSATYGSYGLISHYKLRLGALAACNLIPIVLTSSVNSPLTFLLDIPYDTINILHRWLARITTLEVLAHVLCHIIETTQKHGAVALRESFRVPFITHGLIAAAFLFLITVLSIKPLRSLAYEFFHCCHIALNIIILALVWLHVKTQMKWYVLTATVLWAASRLLGFLVTGYRSLGVMPAIALLEYLPGDAVRITLHPSRYWKPLPGQHIYLSTPALKSFGAHPFSIVWADDLDAGPQHGSMVTLASLGLQPRKDLYITPRSNDKYREIKSHHVYYCIVKCKSGYTKALLEHAKKGAETGAQEISLRAFISGPHRGQQSLSGYTTVLLFAGGVGITHQFPYIKTLFRPQRAGTPIPMRVHLVWAVPGVAVLKWIKPWLEEISDIKRQSIGSLILDLYVTRPFNRRDTPPTTPFNLHEGRPCIDPIVERVVSSRLVGPMCISTCGSGSFSDDVRRAARNMLKAGADLDLLEERYGW